MLASNILVYSNEIHKNFLKDIPLSYYIYSSEELPSSDYFKMLKSLDIKIIDTYNNGAITININKNSELSIYGQLKNF